MFKELISRHPSLAACGYDIEQAKEALIACYKRGGKLLICGNGGSCADSDHIVGELLKGFLKKRPLSEAKKQEMRANYPEISEEVLLKLQGSLPAIALPSITALNTAFCNDVDPALMYAQSVMGLGKPEDMLIAISTSGNSVNAVGAARVAKALGLTVVALTGMGGGKLAEIADITVRVPETETFKIQELHLPVYHYICAAVEAEFFAE